LKVQLVNESGQGVAGGYLFLSQWWGRAQTLGPYLSQKTDADGWLQWLSAPKGEMELSFGKAGYRYSRTNKLSADGVDHVIVLHPVATLSGSVTDADTGAPVASFKYTLGHSQPWVPDDPVPLWELQSQVCANGLYKAVIDEEQAPYLRIEADGYETIETGIQLTNGVIGVRDFQLRRQIEANSIRGTVLLPDGSPAVAVEVALCTGQVGVMLKGIAFEPGAFGNHSRSQQYDYRRKTDEHGSFSFDPKPGAHTLVAVGLAGLGQVRCFDFSEPLEIRLQPWGRIEGSVRTRDGQWADRKVKWRKSGEWTRWMTLFYQSEGFSARSDATGKFTLEHVPPGTGLVEIDDGPGSGPILSPSIQVNPGETMQVQVGGAGRRVTGRMVAPTGVEIRNWSNQVTLARIQVKQDVNPFPTGLVGNAAERWKLEFADSEAGQNFSRNQYLYDFKVDGDGSFTIPEVLPGKYSLFVFVGQGYLGSGPDSATFRPSDPSIASGGRTFTVADAPGDSVPSVDLGEIILSATH
jgi:hypothetical protein